MSQLHSLMVRWDSFLLKCPFVRHYLQIRLQNTSCTRTMTEHRPKWGPHSLSSVCPWWSASVHVLLERSACKTRICPNFWLYQNPQEGSELLVTPFIILASSVLHGCYKPGTSTAKIRQKIIQDHLGLCFVTNFRWESVNFLTWNLLQNNVGSITQ